MVESDYLSFFEKVGIVPPRTEQGQKHLFRYIFAAKGVNGNDNEFWKRIADLKNLQARFLNRRVKVHTIKGIYEGIIIGVHPNNVPMRYTVLLDKGGSSCSLFCTLTFLD